MIDRDMDQDNPTELEKTFRGILLTEKERKEEEERLKRQQEQEDRSLEEGLRFLFKAVLQFILYVVSGAFAIIFSQNLIKTDYPSGILLMGAGWVLIIKGMLTLGGFHSK